MNCFSDASLRGGIPKTNTTMKTYITPNTESVIIMSARMMQSYTPSDGNGSGISGSNPTPGSGSGSGSPKNAPGRVF